MRKFYSINHLPSDTGYTDIAWPIYLSLRIRFLLLVHGLKAILDQNKGICFAGLFLNINAKIKDNFVAAMA